MEIRIDPQLYHDFHSKIAMAMRLPPTSRDIVQDFVNIDVTAEAVAKVIRRNPYCENLLLQEIKALGLKENTPQLQAAIALLGMVRVRDFVCSLSIERKIGRRHPAPGKDGRLGLKASDYLKYATKAEDYASARRLAYPDTAFAAGLMFDLVAAVARETFAEPEGFEELEGEVFKHGLRAALIGTELAKTIKGFSFSKYVFAACLVHDIGKLAMELLFDGKAGSGKKGVGYAAFRASLEEHPCSRAARHLLEVERFGVSHDYLGAQMAYHFSALRGIERAILFHHDPYVLRSSARELHGLACVIALASNMATSYRVPKDLTDPVLRAWVTPELKGFRVEAKTLKKIVENLTASSSV